MRNPHGHVAIYGPGQTIEHDTFTCVHCNAVVIVKAKAAAEDSGGWCLQCNRMICRACAGKGCTPFEKKLEAYERRQAALRSYD